MTIHEITKKRLIEKHGLQATGFKGALCKIAEDLEEDGDTTEIVEYFKQYRVHPDAFRICDFCEVILCYEIEDRHPLAVKTLYRYAHLWDYMLGYDYKIVVITTNRHGGVTAILDHDTMSDYYRHSLIDRKVSPC